VGPPEHRERRQALHGVEELPAQALQQGPLLLGAGLGVPADQRHEQRDQRQRQPHDQRRQPVGQGDRDEHRARHQHREHELRQVAGDVVVHPVEAAAGERRHLAGVDRGGIGGRPGDVRDEPAPQVGDDPGGAAQRGGLRARREHRPGHRDPGDRRDRGAGIEVGEGAPEQAQRGAAEEVGQHPRLPEHQHRERHPGRDRHRQVHPHRTGGGEEPRIERAHQDTGAGCVMSWVMRLRNTQYVQLW
jgi:hypothetical protein